jgi:chemotaxis protein methyltransferase CheR
MEAPRASRPSPPVASRSSPVVPGAAAIDERAFQDIRGWIREVAGINLSNQKKALVVGRLGPRLKHHQLASYGDYFRLLKGGSEPAEVQIAIDRLTTNETQFFREPKHFDFLTARILPLRSTRHIFRVWSAAASSGEEPYSIAMVVAASSSETPWELIGSDLSARMLERARTGHYALARAKSIPRHLLQAYCLKGIGAQEGTFIVDPKLRSRVRFEQINLVAALPQLGLFDVIFLRNVMIYFDQPTKRDVVARVLRHLRPGGYLIVGHSETLNGVTEALEPVVPSIYRRH